MTFHKIPVSVIVVTKNESSNMARCLLALDEFDEVVVVDSNSTDGTVQASKSFKARVENFTWNGIYPKKRQWILDNISLKHDYIFFVDADEEVTSELCAEIRRLDFSCAGYFIKGSYVVDGKILRYGIKNNKLSLFNKNHIAFPTVADLNVEGMGEIEGHYQPVFKRGDQNMKLGHLKVPLLHHAMENLEKWQARHKPYAIWHKDVIEKSLLPKDPNIWRRTLKQVFYKLPMREVIIFLWSYIFKAGFLDGRAGLKYAKSRHDYYQKVYAEGKRGTTFP